MLATGYSAVGAVNTLIGRGVSAENIRFLALVAAPEGIKVFHAAHPTVPLYVAGLGDAGDRIFGTKHD